VRRQAERDAAFGRYSTWETEKNSRPTTALQSGVTATALHDASAIRSSFKIPMKDLTPRWIIVKAVLFLFLGPLAVAMILLEYPDWRIAVMLAVAIWSFCRLYYFAFYVIERYVDPAYKFSGLMSFLKYWFGRGRR
jgi:hypothetical protein